MIKEIIKCLKDGFKEIFSKKNLVYGMAALPLVLLFVSFFCIPTNAYHEDSNGNLVSDNLINNSPNVFEMGAVSYNIGKTYSENKVSSNSRIRTINLISVDSSLTYSLSVSSPYLVIAQGYNDNIQVSSTGTQFNQALSSLSFTGVNQVSIIVRKSDNSSFTSINNISNINLMFNVGDVVSYEPYGQIFYSTNSLNRVARNNYGPYVYATNIDLSYNNGSSSFVYKSYSNIYELALEPFIKFRNQCIEVDDYKFIFTTLGGNSNWKFTLNFTFAASSIRVSDFNEWYFYGPIPYSFIFSNSSSLSGTSSDNPLIVNLTNSGISSTTYVSNFSFTRNNPNIGLAITKVGTPNSTLGYDNGYINGYDDAVADITASYDPIIQQYKDNIQTLADRVSYLENSNRNYTNLIWTIGATPWESFKNIWNVEFGGINIANIVTGLVTALLVIYLIKKVWK